MPFERTVCRLVVLGLTSYTSAEGDFGKQIELPCDLAFWKLSMVGDCAEQLGIRRLDFYERGHEGIT